MNKLILKITFKNEEDFGLEIEFMHWDHRFLYDSKEPRRNPFVHFEASNEFTLYSNGQGEMFMNTFVVPEKEHLKKGVKIYSAFASDDERYLYLQALYQCFTEWSYNWHGFKGESRLNNNDKILVNKEYWVL